MNSCNVLILQDLQNFFTHAIQNPQPYVLVKGGFSRTRKINFERVVLFILSLVKRSLSVELRLFFTRIGELEDLCSKSAFCQARQKLSSQFFKDWNDCLVCSFYLRKKDQVKRWKGFRLCGIDGSDILLPKYEGLAAHFGQKKHRFGSKTMAKIVCCYDLLNQVCLWTELKGWKIAESAVAISKLDQTDSDILLIYDRHYPGFESIYAHVIANKAYLMRINTSFTIVRDFLRSGDRSKVVRYKIQYNQVSVLQKKGYQVDKNTFIKVRLVRIELSTGETEVLITSLLDARKYPYACFAQLYNLRWKVETFFARINDKMGLEVFSGYSPNTIEQEIRAHILLANLHSLFIEDAQTEIDQLTKNRTHKYQPNFIVSLALVIDKLPKLFNKKNLRKTLIEIHQICISYLEPSEKIERSKEYKTLSKEGINIKL